MWRTENSKPASTTTVGKKVWCEVLSALSSPSAAVLASAIQNEKNWRANYILHVVSLVRLQASAPPSECLASCRSGLKALNTSFDFIATGGEVVGSAVDAMIGQVLPDQFRTRMLMPTSIDTGSPSFVLKSPNGHAKPFLSGPDLSAQAAAWASYGCIENSAAESVKSIANTPNPASLISNKVFVLLGATSALGPFKPLCDLGATIACVARPGAKLNGLIEEAKKTQVTLLLPVKKGVDVAGADLLEDAPELAEWISSILPDRDLVIGCYAYLDGEKHVRASVAMDLIVDAVTKKRKNTSIAYLVSPATPCAASAESIAASRKRFDEAPLWHSIFKVGGAFQKLAPEVDRDVMIINGCSHMQGPNYALAKLSQQWRAMVAKDDGFLVSANHAPASR